MQSYDKICQHANVLEALLGDYYDAEPFEYLNFCALLIMAGRLASRASKRQNSKVQNLDEIIRLGQHLFVCEIAVQMKED